MGAEAMSELTRVRELVDRGLPDLWYAVIGSGEVDEKPVAVTRLGERLVVWRDSAGQAHVQSDRCPHRGAPLSMGAVHGDRLTCAYHGVQIDAAGTIADVPALPDCPLIGKKAVRSYPVIEAGGGIFAWFGESEATPPKEFGVPEELTSPEWSGFLCTASWACNYQYALDNLVDPMHGSYLHAQSFTLAYGSKQDRFRIDETNTGFVVGREGQRDVNFDWTEWGDTGGHWIKLDIPYPNGAGPGGPFRIVGFCTPIDHDHTQVFFWRLRKVSGWQRDLWRFLYRNRLEERHWHVLEQDRVILEKMPFEARDHERLYQHDIGVTRLRRILQQQAKERLERKAAAE